MPRVTAKPADRRRLRAGSGSSSPTRTACRAGGRRPSASRTCAASRGAGPQWTAVLETERGTGVRADFRCTGATAGERYAWEQEIEGTPFERILRAARLEIELEPEGGGDRGHADQRGGPARALAAGLADDARRRARAPRRGARRDRAGARRMSPVSAEPRAPRTKWWGWGDPDKRTAARRPRRWRCCAPSSATASRPAAVELDEVALPERRAAARRDRRGRRRGDAC